MLNRVRRQRPILPTCRLRRLPHLRHPPRPFLQPQVLSMSGCLDTTAGTVVLMNGRTVATNAGLTRMLNMLLVIGRSVIAAIPGWKATGNRH